MAQQVILIDGDCSFCNHSARFVIARDAAARFAFASLQSEVGRTLLKKHGVAIDPEAPSTMVLIAGEKVYTKSSAALRVAAQLGFPWQLAAAGLILPKLLRDKAYDFVARRRHRLVKGECPLPSPEERSRFLDVTP